MDAKNPKQRLKGNASAPHVWLVMLKALSAVARQLEDDLQRCGLSNTDFRVLEALLHKGPLPVNVIGPRVNLTAGAISVAIDRLEVRGPDRESTRLNSSHGSRSYAVVCLKKKFRQSPFTGKPLALSALSSVPLPTM